MDEITEEEFNMTKKKETIEASEAKQSFTEVDLLWDGWLNSFKTLQTYQNDLEAKSIQAFEKQKELINTTRETLVGMENETNKLTGEWKENLQKTVKTVNKEQAGPIVSNWMNQVEEFNDKVQALSWTPSKVMLDLFSQSQDQLESNVKLALEQQQTGRSEALKAIGELTEQMKETHKGILENSLFSTFTNKQ